MLSLLVAMHLWSLDFHRTICKLHFAMHLWSLEVYLSAKLRRINNIITIMTVIEKWTLIWNIKAIFLFSQSRPPDRATFTTATLQLTTVSPGLNPVILYSFEILGHKCLSILVSNEQSNYITQYIIYLRSLQFTNLF